MAGSKKPTRTYNYTDERVKKLEKLKSDPSQAPDWIERIRQKRKQKYGLGQKVSMFPELMDMIKRKG